MFVVLFFLYEKITCNLRLGGCLNKNKKPRRKTFFPWQKIYVKKILMLNNTSVSFLKQQSTIVDN